MSDAVPLDPARAAHFPCVGGSLGGWKVLDVLGEGGMGLVFRAEKDGVEAALKVIQPKYLADRECRQRFQLEAEAGARVRHPNVVRTFGLENVETPKGPLHYLVLEYVRGRSLADVVKDGPIPEQRLRPIVASTAAGLAAIHAAGLLHRDVKPENLLLGDDGRVRITDLGLARLRAGNVRLSRTGQFLGSFLFTAPEQLGPHSDRLTPSADLYSLGLVTFLLATGRRAFEVRSIGDVIAAHLQETPAPLRSVRPEASAFLEAVVATLLQKEPSARFESAAALRDTMEAGEASAWWRARAAAAPRLRPRFASPRGRANELARLSAAWAAVQEGVGGAALVTGEEGVGKSCVLHAFLDAVEGASGRVAHAACGEDDADLRGLLVEARVPGGPRVLAVDALERASPDEVATVRALLALAEERPLLVVAAAGPGLDPALREAVLATPGAQELPLPALPDAVLRDLVVERFGAGDAADAVAPPALAAAGGNPRVLEALLVDLERTGAVREVAGVRRVDTSRLRTDLPRSVLEMLDRRLARVTPEERALLEVAAAEGVEFDARVVARALRRSPGAVEAALDALGRRAFVVGRGRRRALESSSLRDALRTRLDDPRRAAAHRALALAWREAHAEGEAAAGLALPAVARHALSAGDAAAAEPVVLPALAALRAREASAEGLGLCALALDADPMLSPSIRASVLAWRADAMHLAGRFEEELECAQASIALVEAAGGTPSPAVLDGLGRCLLALGAHRRLREAFGERLARADASGDRATQAACHVALADLARHLREPSVARVDAERGLLLARAEGLLAIEVRALEVLADVFQRQGRSDLAREHQLRRLSGARRLQDPRATCDAHGGVAGSALGRGRWHEARVHLDLGIEIARRIGYALGTFRLHLGLARAALARGALADAERALHAARRVDTGAVRPAEGSALGTLEAALDLARGRDGDAALRALRATGLAAQSGGRREIGRTLLFAGRLAERRADPVEAERWYREAQRALPPEGESAVAAQLGIARIAWAAGRPEDAGRALERAGFAAFHVGRPGPRVLATAWSARAGVASPERALASLVEGAEGMTIEEQRECHRLLGEVTKDAWHAGECDRDRSVPAGEGLVVGPLSGDLP